MKGEAIAHNLRTMFGLKVPIISIVIGEGGSGGALAIGCANKLFMLENSVFYVARCLFLFGKHDLSFMYIYSASFVQICASYYLHRHSIIFILMIHKY